MIFTDYQKEIIRNIAITDVNTNYSMIEILFKDHKTKIEKHTCTVYTEDEFILEERKRLLDYNYVYKILEKNEMIHSIKANDEATGIFDLQKPFYHGNNKFYISDTIIKYITANFRDKLFIASNELKQFIENDFKSKEELYQERLIVHQEKSMAFTRKVAIGSIVLSIISLAASLFLASNRKVEITNPGAFSNKMNVIIEKDFVKPKTK